MLKKPNKHEKSKYLLVKVVTEKAKLEEAKKKQDEEVVDMEVAAEIAVSIWNTWEY